MNRSTIFTEFAEGEMITWKKGFYPAQNNRNVDKSAMLYAMQKFKVEFGEGPFSIVSVLRAGKNEDMCGHSQLVTIQTENGRAEFSGVYFERVS